MCTRPGTCRHEIALVDEGTPDIWFVRVAENGWLGRGRGRLPLRFVDKQCPDESPARETRWQGEPVIGARRSAQI